MPKANHPPPSALISSLQALAEQVKAAHSAQAKHLPTTDPDAYYHALDCNLHTMVGERFVRDAVQVLELKNETRVQYLASQPELGFFVDIPKKKGKVRFLFLDGSLLHKEAASYRDVDEMVRALDDRRAGNAARTDAGSTQRPPLAALPRGDEEAAARLGRVCWEKRSDSRAHAAVTSTLEELGRLGTLAAAHEIYAIAVMGTRYTKRRNAAKAILEQLAGRAGVSVDALIMQAVPQDPSAADRERVMAVQSRRLERMMVDGKRLPFERFRAEFLAHPVLLPLCEKLVFAVFDPAGAIEISFRPDGEKLRDARNQELAVAATAQVGVAHAVELSAAKVLDDWRAAKLEQPFLQLERPVRALSPRQASSNLIFDFKFYRRDFLHEQEWWGYKVDADYMSDVDTFAVQMERDDKHIEAKLDGQGRIFAIGMGKVDLDYELARKDYVATPGDTTPFAKLHPVSQSELLYAFLGSGRSSR